MSFPVWPQAVIIGLYRRVISSLWFAPALYAVGGMMLVFLVGQIGQRLPESVLKLFPAAELGTVRGVLQLLASSTLTVATVTFSILMVVLTMTASNFSPRALAGFMRDRVNQNMLGVFLGSFSFGATGMLLTRLELYDGHYLGLILLTALGAGFLTLGAFVYFIHHTAMSVQITSLVVRLHREADQALSEFLKLAEKNNEPSKSSAVLPSEAPGLVEARTAGYIQVLDSDRVFHLAVENDLMVRVLRHAGEFAARGVPLCEVWPAAKLTPQLADEFRNAYAVGAQRTAEDDPLLGMELLAEVAVRALSPGINDPNTAVNCLHYLGDLLVRIAAHGLPRQVLRDERGLRVVIATPDFRDFLDRSVLVIGGAGAGHVLVAVTILSVLHDVASVTQDRAWRQVIGETARSIADLALQEVAFQREREQVQETLESLSFDGSDKPGSFTLPRHVGTV